MAGMEPISTYPITTNSFYNVARLNMAGIFRPISTTSIINSYITPKVTIITTYILPPITIITTDITHIGSITTISTSLVFMDIFIYMEIIK